MPVLVEQLDIGALSLGDQQVHVYDHQRCFGAAQGGCEDGSDDTGGDPALLGGAGAPDRASGPELHSCPWLVRPGTQTLHVQELLLCS